jgi:hypothetical protein
VKRTPDDISRRWRIAVRPYVLVPLDEDRVVARDQQARRGIQREVVGNGARRSLVFVPEFGFGRRAAELRWARGAMDKPRLEQLVIVRECADEKLGRSMTATG